MKKYFSLFLILLASCATKKHVQKSEVTQRIEHTKVDSSQSIVRYAIETENLYIVPIDSTKPIEINGVTYRNATIRLSKVKDNTIVETKKKTVQKSLNEVKTKTSEKKIERFNYWWFLLPLLVLGWMVRKAVS